MRDALDSWGRNASLFIFSMKIFSGKASPYTHLFHLQCSGTTFLSKCSCGSCMHLKYKKQLYRTREMVQLMTTQIEGDIEQWKRHLHTHAEEGMHLTSTSRVTHAFEAVCLVSQNYRCVMSQPYPGNCLQHRLPFYSNTINTQR